MRACFKRFGERLVERCCCRQNGRSSSAASGRSASWPCVSPPRKPSSRPWAPASRTACGSATSAWWQNAWGKPEVVYSARGERLRRQLGIGDGHVTLTDEAGLIVAVAVLMKPRAPQAARKRAPQAPEAARSRQARA